MENKFKNGDIIRVTNDKGSLKWVGRYVKVGSKGTVVDDVRLSLTTMYKSPSKIKVSPSSKSFNLIMFVSRYMLKLPVATTH